MHSIDKVNATTQEKSANASYKRVGRDTSAVLMVASESEGDLPMVHVITIDDESYAELFKVKRQNDCSFSKAIKHLIAQNKKVKTNVLAFAGSVNESDIDMRSIDSMEKSMQSWARRI